MLTSKRLRELHAGDIDIRLYGDRDNIEVSANQSVPKKHGDATYYQRINHRFPVKAFAEIEPELERRLEAFFAATASESGAA